MYIFLLFFTLKLATRHIVKLRVFLFKLTLPPLQIHTHAQEYTPAPVGHGQLGLHTSLKLIFQYYLINHSDINTSLPNEIPTQHAGRKDRSSQQHFEASVATQKARSTAHVLVVGGKETLSAVTYHLPPDFDGKMLLRKVKST